MRRHQGDEDYQRLAPPPPLLEKPPRPRPISDKISIRQTVDVAEFKKRNISSFAYQMIRRLVVRLVQKSL